MCSYAGHGRNVWLHLGEMKFRKRSSCETCLTTCEEFLLVVASLPEGGGEANCWGGVRSERENRRIERWGVQSGGKHVNTAQSHLEYWRAQHCEKHVVVRCAGAEKCLMGCDGGKRRMGCDGGKASQLSRDAMVRVTRAKCNPEDASEAQSEESHTPHTNTHTHTHTHTHGFLYMYTHTYKYMYR